MGKEYKKYSEVIRDTIIWYGIVPIILVSLIAYLILFFGGNRLIVKENGNSNEYVSNLMEDNLSEYRSLMNNISRDEGLISIIKYGTKPNNIYEVLYKFINKRILKSNFYVFDKEGKMVISNKNTIPEYVNKDNLFVWGIFNRMKLRKEEVITMVNKVEQDRYAYGTLILGKAIIDNDEIIGYIIFDFSDEDIFDLVTGYTTSDIIITDRHNIIAATNNKYSDQLYRLKNDFRQKDGYVKIVDEWYFIKTTSLKDTNLFVYSITNLNFFNRAFLIGGIFLFILFLVILYVMLYISKRVAYSKTMTINEIVKAIESIQEGNLETKLKIESEDEFGIIVQAYNNMLVDIKKLIEINKVEVALRMQSEIKQLEAQFNPHFLFNTLETIRIMIKLDKNVASDIIVNLSSLLRYGINNEIHSVKIRDDIEYIKNYLEILKYRFGDRLQFKINIDDEVLDSVVPKLILQPIIENSIKYGFEKKSTINIEIYSIIDNGKTYIIIKDDGYGISSEKMKHIKILLNKKQNDTDTIGLYNVQKRIELIYGKEYGLDINSIEGKGTIVKIVLPYIRRVG